MADPFIAEIRIFAGNFAPRGYAFCDGQLLPISQNTALFSVIGTIYGGDGRTTTGLPNLKGRAPMHPGRGTGLTTRQIGQRGGAQTHTLTGSQVPDHKHEVLARMPGMDDSVEPPQETELADSGDPSDKAFAKNAGANLYGSTSDSNNTTLANAAASTYGDSQPHNNMQPYIAMNYVIALTGTYPSRS